MSSGWGYHHQHHQQQQQQQRHQFIGSSTGAPNQPAAIRARHAEANGGDYGSGYQGGGEDEEDEYEVYSEYEEETGVANDGQVRASSSAGQMHHVCVAAIKPQLASDACPFVPRSCMTLLACRLYSVISL
jgi:hypothetical protein